VSQFTDGDADLKTAPTLRGRGGKIMKKIFVLIVAVAFVLSTAGFCFAAYEFYHGTITKISGNKITVQDEKGKLQTLTTSGKIGWKVGDKVVVEKGKLFSPDDWKARSKSVPGTPQEIDKMGRQR
jgi:hypothetical protein